MFLTFLALPLLAGIVAADSSLHVDSDELNLIGRWEVSDSNNAFADWGSSAASFRFSGTEASILFADPLSSGCNGYYLDVFVDCRLENTLAMSLTSEREIVLVSGLEAAEHSVRVVKRTEVSDPGLCGAWALAGFSSDGDFLPFEQTCRTEENRKILFVGDSLTAGYGIDDLDPCPFQASTENSDHTYAAFTSLYFGAQYQTIAWSGKGVVRNYGDVNQESDPEATMPYLFNRTLGTYSEYDYPTSASVINTYNKKSFIPDVISINLGSNDYSTTPYPTSSAFIDRYVTFASMLHIELFPSSKLFLTCGPVPVSVNAPFCSNVQEVVSEINARGGQAVYVPMMGLLTTDSDVGCSGHPSAKGDLKMARVLIEAIDEVMKWSPVD